VDQLLDCLRRLGVPLRLSEGLRCFGEGLIFFGLRLGETLRFFGDRLRCIAHRVRLAGFSGDGLRHLREGLRCLGEPSRLRGD